MLPEPEVYCTFKLIKAINARWEMSPSTPVVGLSGQEIHTQTKLEFTEWGILFSP